MKLWLIKTTWGSGRVGYTDQNGNEVNVGRWAVTGKHVVSHKAGRILGQAIINSKDCWALPNYVVELSEPDAFYTHESENEPWEV